jgi:hypothetical protein
VFNVAARPHTLALIGLSRGAKAVEAPSLECLDILMIDKNVQMVERNLGHFAILIY